MRWIISLLMLCFSLPAYGQENEAEKIFRAMEKKVSEAKSLKVTFEVDGGRGDEFARARGSVAIGEGNEFKLELQGIMNDKACRILMICDGKRVLLRGSWAANDSSDKLAGASANRNKALLAAVPRLGFLLLGCTPPDLDTDYIDRNVHVSNFHLGGSETVNGISCQVIHYRLRLGPNNGSDANEYSAKVWIDVKSASPTRFQRRRNDGISEYQNEVCIELILNPKLDRRLFELPK